MFEIIFENNNIIFETKGYGHGVGLSQDGANCLAANENTYKEIIMHYYTGVSINKINR